MIEREFIDSLERIKRGAPLHRLTTKVADLLRGGSSFICDGLGLRGRGVALHELINTLEVRARIIKKQSVEVDGLNETIKSLKNLKDARVYGYGIKLGSVDLAVWVNREMEIVGLCFLAPERQNRATASG